VQGLSVADSSYVTSSDVVRFAIRAAATRPVSDGERASANNNQPNQAGQASRAREPAPGTRGNRQQRGSKRQKGKARPDNSRSTKDQALVVVVVAGASAPAGDPTEQVAAIPQRVWCT